MKKNRFIYKDKLILYGYCPEYIKKGSDKMTIKHYDEKPIEQMNEDELAMERFVHHGGDKIIEKGQCVHICGLCKSMMTGVSGTSQTGKQYNYYTCVNARKENAIRNLFKKIISRIL